jgi:hypothetical protein
MSIEQSKPETLRLALIGPRPIVEETFHRLATKWRKETMFKSSPRDVFLDPVYLQIIGMGEEIVPLIWKAQICGAASLEALGTFTIERRRYSTGSNMVMLSK